MNLYQVIDFDKKPATLEKMVEKMKNRDQNRASDLKMVPT